MTAVSQSYPNYLGGLNEQPDELKKPGQLVEALNVIPDPTIGLCRRPGFKKINTLSGADPLGSWFSFDLDQHYIGCINPDGTVRIFNEAGDLRTVKYLPKGVLPHKKYSLTDTEFIVSNDDNKIIDSYPNSDFTTDVLSYLAHTNPIPLKTCISKNNIVVTNPDIYPQLHEIDEPTDSQARKYYSFLNLKTIDRDNYNYTFKRFYGKLDGTNEIITFKTIREIDIEEVIDIDEDYERDLTQPWKGEVREISLTPNDDDAKEKANALIRVTFETQVVQWKSDDGDGYPTRVRHSWDVSIIDPGKGFKTGNITVTEDGVAGGPDIKIKFDITKTEKTTSVDFDTVTIDENSNDAESILRDLAAGFDALGIDKVRIVGTGIYLENNIPFSISTSEAAVADVMNSQRFIDEEGEFTDKVPIVRVNTVAELPLECYEGFLVQVTNSFDGSNDFYLRYTSESKQAEPPSGTNPVTEKADGFWEEVAKPYEPTNPRNWLLPHLITAVEQGETGEYAFIVSRMRYLPRTAGDISNNLSMFADNAKITNVDYYKNRLFFLTDIGTVVTSRAGEINQLHINTAIRTSPIDPIDIPTSSNARVPLHGSAVVNNGLVLFGDSEQYMLSTNSDLLTSETADLTKIANYTFEPASNPVYLGTNIGFVSKGFTRFYEMTNLYDRGPVDINERSQQVQQLFGRRFDMPASSREQSQVVVYKRYEGATLGDSSPNIMVYRFRQENSQNSTQTSWVKWQIEDLEADPTGVKRVVYVTMPEDKMLMVVADRNRNCYLWSMDSSTTSGLNPNRIGQVPYFTDGWVDADTPGNPFKTIIQFPTIFAQSRGQNPKSDVTANLTIHRVKLSTASVGTYNLTIERRGYDTYKLLVEQTPADEYNSNYPPLYGEKVETVPIYTRNHNLRLTLSTDYDAPLTLRSMTWEGDWNRPYYKSV